MNKAYGELWQTLEHGSSLIWWWLLMCIEDSFQDGFMSILIKNLKRGLRDTPSYILLTYQKLAIP